MENQEGKDSKKQKRQGRKGGVSTGEGLKWSKRMEHTAREGARATGKKNAVLYAGISPYNDVGT